MNQAFSTIRDIAFIGEGSLLPRCLEFASDKGFSVKFIVSTSQEVISYALARDLPAYSSIEDVPIADLCDLDYLFSVAHLEIIPDAILEAVDGKVINFHDGPLPEYSGLNVSSWALYNGEQGHAVCWHFVAPGKVDSGNIIAQTRFSLEEFPSSILLNVHCFEVAFQLFKEEVLPQIKSAKKLKGQAVSGIRKLYKRHAKPENAGVLVWNDKGANILRQLRALDFGTYNNPFVSAKIVIKDNFYIVNEMKLVQNSFRFPPGSIVEADQSLKIACQDQVLEVSELQTVYGEKVSAKEIVERFGLVAGDLLEDLTQSQLNSLQSDLETSSIAEYKFNKLATKESFLDKIEKNNSQATQLSRQWIKFVGEESEDIDSIISAVTAYFCLNNRSLKASLLVDLEHSKSDFSFDVTPVCFELEEKNNLEDVKDIYLGSSALSLDYLARYKSQRASDFVVAVIKAGTTLDQCWNPELIVEVDPKNGTFRIVTTVEDQNYIQRLENELSVFIPEALKDQKSPLSAMNLLGNDSKHCISVLNNTHQEDIDAGSVSELFIRQAQSSPERPAVTYRDQTINYQMFGQKVSSLARALLDRGVKEGDRIGIYLPRSIEMLTAVLGVLHVGATYVPLDPSFPAERLNYISSKARLKLVISEPGLERLKTKHDLQIINVEQLLASSSEMEVQAPSELAYIMFTSGSTGEPKGVMVKQSNLLNFFRAMDQLLPHDQDSLWLAVTSLSFDISILELLWTVCRGFHVLIYDPKDGIESADQQLSGDLDFSLSYFASESTENSVEDGYDLLFKGVEFADQNGFKAVWTPERHFHSFGGLFPNPSVLSAALAARTKNIEVRAGSVVAPLHHPVRIAEDWALVDQISKGRTGISFASGWQENDFVFNPDKYDDRKEEMFNTVKKVQSLWRGESINFKGVAGKDVSVAIKPLPVSADIPVWITAAGNPDTFRRAAESGANVLTHLLGQSISDLKEKIQLYRQVWKEAGHTGKGKVTLMVHTFVGEDRAYVRQMVKEPLTAYLQSAVSLIKEAPYAFPTFKKPNAEIARKVEKGVRDFSTDEIAQLTDFAFERYFESSGLFGTVDECVTRAMELQATGVDEIACLIDFGIKHTVVLDSLPYLNRIRQKSQQQRDQSDFTFNRLLASYNVSHLQATPSFFEILTQSPSALDSLKKVSNILIGGEALREALLARLRPHITASVFNMYGPTETTIWSTACKVSENNWRPLLGSPLANTEVFIVDHLKRIVNCGVVGEICIAGAGVSQGYVGQPELSKERFVEIKNLEGKSVVIYRTGDFGRLNLNGELEFVGREDQQVKIAGHRIELKEIEIALTSLSGVFQAVVAVDNEAGGQLVAFYRTAPGMNPGRNEIRNHLKSKLPEYMVPSLYKKVISFPLTPNGKIDRKQLLEDTGKLQVIETSGSEASVLQKVRRIWSNILQEPEIDSSINIFDLGANSLMVVQAVVQLREVLEQPVALVDVFQNPTIESFVARFSKEQVMSDDSKIEAHSRAVKRKAFLTRRNS